MTPLTTAWPTTAAPSVAVTVQVMVEFVVLTTPVLDSVHWVSLVWVRRALEFTSATPARAPS